MATRYKGIWAVDESDVTELILFRKVRWVVKGGTAGDECILKDELGNVLFHSVADGANFVDSFELNRMARITVDTLDSGELYLYE
jgi:hypothetical protein